MDAMKSYTYTQPMSVLIIKQMEQEATFLDFQPYPTHRTTILVEQIQLDRRSFSQIQQPDKQQESSSPRSLRNANKKESEFRNFPKHYTRTIKNIIKSKINVWPLDKITYSVASTIVESIEQNHHPPKKMIDSIFCRKIDVQKLQLIGYEALVDKFTSEELKPSCQKIKKLVLAYIRSEDSDLMIGAKIKNPPLFREYLKKVTKEYENNDRFSFRLRPDLSKQIRQEIMRKENQKRKQKELRKQHEAREYLYKKKQSEDLAGLVLQQDKFSEKFAQSQSNFLDCI